MPPLHCRERFAKGSFHGSRRLKNGLLNTSIGFLWKCSFHGTSRLQNGLFRNKLCGFQIGSFHRMNILVREHVPKIPWFDTTDVGGPNQLVLWNELSTLSHHGNACRPLGNRLLATGGTAEPCGTYLKPHLCRGLLFNHSPPPSQPHVVTTKSYLSRTTLWCPRRYLVVTLLCMLLFWDTKFVVIRPPNLMREEPSK